MAASRDAGASGGALLEGETHVRSPEPAQEPQFGLLLHGVPQTVDGARHDVAAALRERAPQGALFGVGPHFVRLPARSAQRGRFSSRATSEVVPVATCGPRGRLRAVTFSALFSYSYGQVACSAE
ncbi:hypothetical protein Srut_30350 [Streptomyces rutgersensis]|nr:hypothetical protein Srut_30350 [Streptomyces rutgersensis]